MPRIIQIVRGFFFIKVKLILKYYFCSYEL